MSQAPPAPPPRDTSESPDVAALVRLHHRRRGWAWVAAGSAIGLAVDAGISVNLNLTGTAETVSLIPVVALLTLVLAGLAVVIADTARLHRASAAVRASAKRRVSHHPLYAHAYRYPPHHRASWVAAIVMLAAMTGITAYILPPEVNGWAYVTGAEHQDTFHPVSYDYVCSGVRAVHCTRVTDGYLSRSGAHVMWGTPVPLGQPFSVRAPLWAWGAGRSLDTGYGSAIPTILAGLFFDGIALLLLYIIVVIMRETPPGRRRRMPAQRAGSRNWTTR